MIISCLNWGLTSNRQWRVTDDRLVKGDQPTTGLMGTSFVCMNFFTAYFISLFPFCSPPTTDPSLSALLIVVCEGFKNKPHRRGDSGDCRTLYNLAASYTLFSLASRRLRVCLCTEKECQLEKGYLFSALVHLISKTESSH